MSSSGQQKRRRTSTTSSSSSRSYDTSSGADRKDWKEEDGEEERAAPVESNLHRLHQQHHFDPTSDSSAGNKDEETNLKKSPAKKKRKTTHLTNDTDTNHRRSELFEEEEDEDAIATGAAAEATTAVAASTNATVRPQVTLSNKWELTPVSLFIRMLGYMDNDTLMIMCLVCKQIRDMIWTGRGMENKLVRIFELSPSQINNDGQSRVRRFVSHMNQYFRNATKTRILQGFQHWKVQDVVEFDDNRLGYVSNDHDELERLTQNIRMTGIVSLDMTLLLPIARHRRYPNTLYRAISFMVPNLQKLDVSHTCMNPCILEHFAVRCPRLEIIRWNYNGGDGVMSIDAECDDIQSMNNLKELYADNLFFRFNHDRRIDENGDTVDVDDDDDNDNNVTEIEAMSDSNNYPNIFLFCRLYNNPLERISIRNAQYTDPDWVQQILPQNVLMKFVRKAPATLVWFRSDLSQENIQILQSERPGIQLLN